jgi:hypothetical protein
MTAASLAPAVPLPCWTRGSTVIPPPDSRAGSWAGAPGAVLVGGTFYLAYRLRRPVGEGRGYANVVARSDDGVHFDTLTVLRKEQFGAESLERPALVVTDDGRWRLYVSCATPGSKHWRVEALEADRPARLNRARPVTVLPGDAVTGVKDPVIMRTGTRWHLWASCHPLTRPGHEDRMRTAYATSGDGVTWRWRGTVLRGRRGAWDERGARVTSVLPGRCPIAWYDGRASAAENWEERTGTATGVEPFGRFAPQAGGPAASSPHRPGGLRYLSVVPLGDGSYRLYYEASRADGTHELRTELWGAPQLSLEESCPGHRP